MFLCPIGRTPAPDDIPSPNFLRIPAISPPPPPSANCSHRQRYITMNVFRIASRLALSARAPVARSVRTYADAAGPTDKIKLSLTLPHQSIFKTSDVVQVNIPAESGDMGILANHVPSIEQLRPGVIDIIEENGGSKQFFISGGFAVVQPDSQLSINAVEAYPLDHFSPEAIKSQLAEAHKIASGSGSEQDVAEAKIEIEVLESLQAAVKA
ncbi:F1 complex, delta/epsilon subunit of ATPase [Kalaharituber pfeilii]|nr:F1 complex, delta/epsilon subunit of ATPase [Kalaharituber pfeilii]